jgi:hypothetical protein
MSDVEAFLETVTPAKRRRDAERLLEVMRRATDGVTPEISRGIVGYGSYHYKYASGREGDAPAASFAPRKAATTVYLMDGIDRHADQLDRLGPHTTGVGCLYLKDLDTVDLAVLEGIVRESFRTLTAATFTNRAREEDATD